MKSRCDRLLDALLVVLLFALLVSVSYAQESERPVNVKVGFTEEIGHYLTDGNGMTLYYFTRDMVGKSACTGDCLYNWPIFHVDEVVPAEGLVKDHFGEMIRKDGTRQTTYLGYALYYFVQDKQPGEVKGQGVNNAWFVLDPFHTEF